MTDLQRATVLVTLRRVDSSLIDGREAHHCGRCWRPMLRGDRFILGQSVVNLGVANTPLCRACAPHVTDAEAWAVVGAMLPGWWLGLTRTVARLHHPGRR